MTTSEERTASLAQKPLREVSAKPNFFTGPFTATAEVFRHRELLFLLVKRELKSRYKDSSLGFIWSMGRPLAMLLIYYVALGKFLGADRGIDGFAIFIFTGLTAWGLFNEIVISSTNTIVSNSGLVKKIYLPRELFPLSATGSALFNFSIQLGILIFATAVMNVFPTGMRWLYFLAAVAVILVTALSWAMLLSVATVYLRDLQHLVEIVLMIAFWLSPVVYSWQTLTNNVPNETVQQIYLTNPMTIAILAFQKTFWIGGDETPFPANLDMLLLMWFGIGLITLWVFHYVFTRLQRNIAQEL